MLGILFRGLMFLFVMAWYTVGVFQVIDNYFRDEFKKQIDIQPNKLQQPTVVTDSHTNRIYNDRLSQCVHVEYGVDSDIKEQHCNGMRRDNVGDGINSPTCAVQSASNANAVTESERTDGGRQRRDNGKDGHYATGSDRTCMNNEPHDRP